MKKKIFAMLLSAAVAVSLVLPFSVSAADAMKATAKAGDPVIDGVISDGEYGDPFVMSAENSQTWAGLAAISSPITYRFAWSTKGLYVALSFDASVNENSQLQINCNPGGLLDASDPGLFITINPCGVVRLHNHATPLGEGKAEGIEITSSVTLQSKVDGNTKVIEVLIPMDAFKVKGSSFVFSAGEMACSTFAVILNETGAASNVAAAVTSDLADWTVGKLGLGKLTLEAAAETPVEKPTEAPTQKPDDGNNPGTGDSSWLIFAACAVILTVVVSTVVYKKSKISA